jgi:hypothetical protein
MFGFGNSKQKKYKKALEEFLQKMMTVQDYFEIIQARGKGHAQMAEMLGVKVSDTDYWAKEHFEEYKSRLSESNDPLAEIELRLKNYSFIKKEMEGFINYAKELEMNLTQGFVDDYYATVATFKSLTMCNDFFVFKVSEPVKNKYNDLINKVLDLPEDIVVVEDDKLILWVYKSVVNENTGDVIDSLDGDEIKRNVNLFENKFFKVKSDPFTIVGYFETKNQALSFYNTLALRKFPNHLLETPYFKHESWSSPIQSETYRKEVRVSIQACSVGLTARKSTSFMVEFTFNLILDDLKNKMSNEKLENNGENNLLNTDELKDDILRGVEMSFDWFKKENPQVEKESSDKTLELWFKFIKYCYCNEPETYELNEIFPFKPTELMIKAHKQTITWFREYYVDHENVASRLVEDEEPAEVVVDKLEEISSEINTGDFFNLLNTESTKENSEKLQTKIDRNDDMINQINANSLFDTNDVRELIDQLKNHKPKIKIILTELLRGDWQLHPDFEITEEFKSSGAFVYDSHGLTKDDHETDCGQYHNLNCEFDETKDVYGNSFEFIGVGYFSLDKFIQYLEDFVKEGGCNNGYDTDSEADFSYDGFKSVFNDWLWEARVEELNVADSVESHDDIEFVSLDMCYAGIQCIGWQGIHEVRSNEVEFEIVID